MGAIVHAEQSFRQKQTERLIQDLSELYGNAGDNWNQFVAVAEVNLSEAIRCMPEFIDRARNVNPNRAFGEALAGGPNPDWIVLLMNVLGDYYEYLERDEREQVLRHCLKYFDGLNFLYSQNHVELLSSPFLITDIVISRWLYWPGLSRPRKFLQGAIMEDLASKDQDVLSSFWVCLAVIWNDDGVTLPMRQWYYKNHPEIVEKTLSFAAAHTYFCAKGKVKEGEDLGLYITSTLNKVYDPLLHHRIREKIHKEDWVRIS